MPAEAECRRLWRKFNGFGEEVREGIEAARKTFGIPPHLNYTTGPYAHQGRAVDAWESASWKGVLEMATGSGKTITAMIATHRLLAKVKSLLVVVAAPYRPLIEQWRTEIAEFGIAAVNLTTLSGSAARDGQIRELGRNLRMNISQIEIALVSNDTLCSQDFIASISAVPSNRFLIADECHNLGAKSFTSNPPECFEYRLGLSATPIRQYDEEGTEALLSYFGPVCFEFTLEDAIGVCLTPYNYFVHFSRLSQLEMDDWLELTDEISRLAWKLEAGKADAYLDNLLRKRRLVLETASSKIDILKQLLASMSTDDLRYTLIYATDKDPKQLEMVNRLLEANGTLFHQLTYEETANRQVTSRILSAFQAGELRVLTAKRVLDEGVNLPQVQKAFVLASTTVRRQWIQRRGRLLRTCKAIGKTHADIHDFVVLPPNTKQALDQDASGIVKSEFDRVWEFARLCQNGAAENGPFQAVKLLQAMLSEIA
jgi:superfamily II DNA or RNA helicase